MNNKDEGGGAMGFLKENWPWLVGGGVLIGGGVWLWNRNKKQEKEKKYWQDDLNFAKSPNNSGSTSSGGSGGTLSANQLPSGARLIFGTSVSGASVGQNLNAIYVIVVDANGTVQNVNGIAVTASCLAPNPCSLDGAKVVTTANGYAIFSGLKFNQPDRGVILQFSAPALPSLTSPGQFDVQGSSGRQ